ncbi:alpha/beta hydrolase [Amycolatopsis magusensis]|uniref:alpha/beta hydrolase n=1 Tax=Amycolatopsis magusensis TaxID=882444 RepID=UPI003794F7F2
MPPAAPSQESVRLRAAFSVRVRPVADRAAPRGYQLRGIRRISDSAGLSRLPRGTRAWPARYGRVRGVWMRAPGADPNRGALLYLHGGGYVFGSPRSHRTFAYRLSKRVGVPVFLLDYRRAPEHPFPAAADDALDAYRLLLAQGYPPEKLLVAGDSAGGHLTACLLGDLARLHLPQPAGAYLVSPWLDLTVASASRRDGQQRDPFLSPAYAAKCRDAYVTNTPWNHPRLNVLGAGKSGWPPILLQVGGTEALVDEARQFAGSHAATELEVWPGQIHVFPIFSNLPEGRDATNRAGEFLGGLLTGCQ